MYTGYICRVEIQGGGVSSRDVFKNDAMCTRRGEIVKLKYSEYCARVASAVVNFLLILQHFCTGQHPQPV